MAARRPSTPRRASDRRRGRGAGGRPAARRGTGAKARGATTPRAVRAATGPAAPGPCAAKGAGTAAPVPRPWPHLTARDVMRRDVLTVDRGTPRSEVARALAAHRISGAPVTDATGAIVGVVTLRDLVAHPAAGADAPPPAGGFYCLATEELEDEACSLAARPAGTEATAGDLMTPEVISVPEDAPLAEVARTLVEQRVHRVLVAAGGHVAGLVGTFEILDALARAGDRGAPPRSPS